MQIYLLRKSATTPQERKLSPTRKPRLITMGILIALLCAVMIGLYTGQSLACSRFSAAYPGIKARSGSVFSVIYGLVTIVLTVMIAWVQTGALPVISAKTLLYGAINGVVLLLYNQMLILASSSGPYSVVMIFMLSGGCMCPLFWNYFHGETLTALQWIGSLLMLVSFFFLNAPPKADQSSDSAEKTTVSRLRIPLHFLLACIFLGLLNGTYGILMDAQQKASGNTENAGMIIITFATAALLSLLRLLLFAGSGGESTRPAAHLRRDFALNRRSVFWALCASVCAATAVNLLLYLLGKIPSSILFSLNNGGVLLLSVGISLLFLGEKINRFKTVGLLFGLSAIVLLSI